MRRLHDPTEANRRRRAAERLRELSARASSERDADVIELNAVARLGLFFLALLVLSAGTGLFYLAFWRIPLPAIAVPLGFVGVLIDLPALGMLAAALLPSSIGLPILSVLTKIAGRLLDGLNHSQW